MEQLLVSTAIDAALDKVDFDSLSGGRVFVDEKQLECTDKKYVVGSVHQRVFQAGGRVVDKAEEADIVLVLYSGAVGTDRSEGFIGMPAIAMPGPFPVQLPEIKLLSQSSQFGTAKIGMVAYDAKTKHALSTGGLARARSDNNNWTVLGLGPFKSGSIRNEVALSDKLQASDERILLSDRRWPVLAHQAPTGPPFAADNATVEMFNPASAPAGPFPFDPNSQPAEAARQTSSSAPRMATEANRAWNPQVFTQ